MAASRWISISRRPRAVGTAVLDQLDDSGNVINTTTLKLKSRDTNPLILKGVTVCDNPPSSCANATNVMNRFSLLRKIVPTSSASVVATPYTVTLPTANYAQLDPNALGQPFWWGDVARKVDDLYAAFEAPSSSSYITYMGMVNNLPDLERQRQRGRDSFAWRGGAHHRLRLQFLVQYQPADRRSRNRSRPRSPPYEYRRSRRLREYRMLFAGGGSERWMAFSRQLHPELSSARSRFRCCGAKTPRLG